MYINPLISIIIPTYNRAHLIVETLNSILAQTYENWECIIVDDGSTDHTDEVVGAYVQKDSRFKYYHRPDEHLPGGNGARNYGFKMSQGEYVNWFDSDDLMIEEFLEIKLDKFTDELDVVFCYGAYFEEKSDYSHSNPSKPKTCNLTPLSYVRHEFHIHIAGPLWKSNFLNDKILFDEKRLKFQDVEFHFRMALYLPKYHFFIDEHLYYIRKTSISISRQKPELQELKDIFSYHFLTYKSTSIVDQKLHKEYRNYTRIKSLRGYYYLISQVKGLKTRLNIYFNLKNDLNELIESENTQLNRIKMFIVVMIITTFKKGFKLIK